MNAMADILDAHVQSVRNQRCTCGWRPDHSDDEFPAPQHRDHQAAALSAAGFGPVQEARAALERVGNLAAAWEARGEHDMKFSKTIPDEDIAMAILTDGAQEVENARHIRNAIKGTCNDDQ